MGGLKVHSCSLVHEVDEIVIERQQVGAVKRKLRRYRVAVEQGGGEVVGYYIGGTGTPLSEAEWWKVKGRGEEGDLSVCTAWCRPQ